MPCIYSRMVSVQSPRRIIEFDFLRENGYEKIGCCFDLQNLSGSHCLNQTPN